MQLRVDGKGISKELKGIVEVLGRHYPVRLGGRGDEPDAVAVVFQPGAPRGSVEVTLCEGTATVLYDRSAQACRGLGALLAGLVKPGERYREETPFTAFGIMLDCSRNAVMTVAHFKQWLRQLALLGYDTAMLYTEETYELPGEECFGYARGRYTADELREIDAYAASLGVEMIGCIQVLGHLEKMLKWPVYTEVTDTQSVIMVGEPRTYELIEKMIAFYAGVFKSRRLHVGMDEAHDMGRGQYMNRHGYKPGFDLFSEHLGRVKAICDRHGLKPMIWSDMYFRMGSRTHDYYDPACRIPAGVKDQIPAGLQLVYWDYYHEDKEFYLDWIRRHRELGCEPVMASGIWTWQAFAYMRKKTEAAAGACLEACREAGVREIVFTMWGDQGAYCEFDTALAGLAFAAERAYGGEAPSHERLAARYAAVCGADYGLVRTAGMISDLSNNPVALLWDDPLLRVAWNSEQGKSGMVWTELDAHFAKLIRQLKDRRDMTEPVDFAHVDTLLKYLRRKVSLNRAVDAALAGNEDEDWAAARAAIRPASRALGALLESFRRQWMRRNKPFGFEAIQYRLGGQQQRLAELAARIDERTAGSIASIPELQPRGNSAGYTPMAWSQLAVSGIA